ncbi:yippee [Pyrrhoderma noxium]|uniref:Yippee n=1 Tax=Pyrrhoderma noxium TaxID=2282107 RepID=A0A286UXD8_9AGAM|nr:yippee [Pyrrhoderma noxium]
MDDLLSRAYCGAQSPKAGLFDDVHNVSMGPRQVWLMRTGAHTVRELKCLGCRAYVGFQIDHAHEPTEKWKDGAYILERQFLFIHSVYECASSESESDDSVLFGVFSEKLELLQLLGKGTLPPTPDQVDTRILAGSTPCFFALDLSYFNSNIYEQGPDKLVHKQGLNTDHCANSINVLTHFGEWIQCSLQLRA